MSKTICIILPNQLFEDTAQLKKADQVYLIEETLLFNQFNFHRQKLVFHRASMKKYAGYLSKKGIEVNYIQAIDARSDIRVLIEQELERTDRLIMYHPEDDWLEKRISKQCRKQNIAFEFLDNPLFINTRKDFTSFFKPEKKKFFQTSFYKSERVRLNILMNQEKPEGGKWTFDAENRKKYPTKNNPPFVEFAETCKYYKEAIDYVNTHFSDNLGKINTSTLYPICFDSSDAWLDAFLHQRFSYFGDYEDAIVREHLVLHHSVLTPMLNVGLIAPQKIIKKALNYAHKHKVHINNTEGFIRQLIGWREFIRGIYTVKSVPMRTTNYWGFKRKIPKSFYDATTGIDPIDHTIQKVLNTGYCHHIERLMVLGNFMLLCEFDPDEVYRWFSEVFIDAYDWVMVPNVYGMSQFADGGLFATKPYISGSNYLLKMSNYKKGPWSEIWDALFWRFMHINRDFFLKNPRLSMLVRSFDKMSLNKQESHLKLAEDYLKRLN